MMLFFDIDGTLLDHQTAEKAGVLGFLSQRGNFTTLPNDRFLQIWSSLTKKYYRLYLEGRFSFVEQRRARIREVYALTGHKITDEEADAAFQDYLTHYKQAWVLYPDVVSCLTELGKNDLGIISNGNSRQQEEKLQDTGIRDSFSVFVTSEDTGYAKPDKRIFLKACAQANKEPCECIYVGDSLHTDYVGSTSAGMIGIWLNRGGRSIAPGAHISVIENLFRLPRLLEQLGPQFCS